MKKYRLIKEYPESEPKGTVFVAHNEINAVFQEVGGDTIIYWTVIEQFSEYFEEIKEEPSYLITAFRDKKGSVAFVIQPDGRYKDSVINAYFEFDWLLKYTEILSVKNSKGEEFTIGDSFVSVGLAGNRNILNFRLINDNLLANTEQGFSYYLHKIEKYKSPIFVSADGKELFENNIDNVLFSVLPKANWQETTYRAGLLIKSPTKEWLHFYTKEARQEYIDNNKPKYSLEDIKKCYPVALNFGKDVSDGNTIPIFSNLIINLKTLGK